MTTPAIRNSSMLISSAKKAYKYLHGTINVYKPAGVNTPTVIKAIKTNLCRGRIKAIIYKLDSK